MVTASGVLAALAAVLSVVVAIGVGLGRVRLLRVLGTVWREVRKW